VLFRSSICPFCALLGYLTPGLIDNYAAGHPAGAGRAYAINVLGCILGPLFACYCLLPFLNERYALIGLTVPLVVFWMALFKRPRLPVRIALTLAIAAAFGGSCFTRDFETTIRRNHPEAQARRDYAASVLSFGTNWDRRLLVNGIGMTTLTPMTKFMAHLPMAIHQGPPQSVLVICFGMGTTYRSAVSWDVDTTVVELVPGVTKAFRFYHPDADQVVANPKGQIVIDDGRRFLNRCGRKFDVIIVDPPPPIEAAGSSLLFSKEFYAIAREHLNTNGVLQMWFPGGDTLTTCAVYRSIYESFPHVHCYWGLSGWGKHLIASNDPIDVPDAQTLAARMPESARRDLLEWNSTETVPHCLHAVLTNEVSLPESLNPGPTVEVTDDHPFNEYYLRRMAAGR